MSSEATPAALAYRAYMEQRGTGLECNACRRQLVLLTFNVVSMESQQLWEGSSWYEKFSDRLYASPSEPQIQP